MTNLIFETDKCIGCGLCVSDCLKHLLTIKDGKVFMEDSKRNECFSCGHCQSICPNGAISIFKKTNEKIPEKNESVENAICLRRSIRKFKSEIPKEKLIEIINITKYSPSACNFRPIKFLVINKEQWNKKIQELMKYLEEKNFVPENYKNYFLIQKQRDIIGRGCYHMIVTYADPKYDQYALDDATIMLTQMELALVQNGFGSFWCGILKNILKIPGTMEIFGLKGFKCYGCMGLGVPDVQYSNLVSREDVDITFLE